VFIYALIKSRFRSDKILAASECDDIIRKLDLQQTSFPHAHLKFNGILRKNAAARLLNYFPLAEIYENLYVLTAFYICLRAGLMGRSAYLSCARGALLAQLFRAGSAL
jgi:hypothetical protein